MTTRLARSGFALAVVVCLTVVGGASGAAQAEESRAAVVVDLGGGEVRTACIAFSGDSVTGLQLLRAAQMDPVVRSYSGEGGAVCKLCGKGCSGGSDCLTCRAPDYWQYWRADGDASYGYSNAGAGSTQVSDGDVEGWRWGSDKTPPPYRTVESICDAGPVYRVQASGGDPPPATTTTTGPPPPAPTTTPTSPGASPSPSTTRPRAVTSPDAAAGAAAVTTTALPPPTTSTTTTSAPASDDASGGLAVGGSEPDNPEESSTWPGVVALVALLGALATWSLRLRLRQRG